MTPERWQRISALYSAAQRLPEDERQAFALEATAGDAELRTELLELLDSETPETDFLENPPLRLAPDAGAAGTPAPFEPGAVICDGRFRVEQVVGRGGMGRVYRAFDTSLGRVVALKTVAVPGALLETTAVRLRQEAALVSKLNHPGICTLYDLGRHEGMDIAVMEFVEGETLAARLRAGMSRTAAIRTVMEILDALDYAHRHRVVHRDVKPGNVILTRSGAKLLDFGIAKLRTGDTQEETELAAGTPAYMAPEQRTRGPVDSRADIYSVGVMLTEMLTRRPGDGKTAADVDAIENPVLRRVVARCLSPDPDGRWQSASDLREALELASMTMARPAGQADVAARSNRIWGGVLAAIVLAGFGAWTLWPTPPAGGSRVVEFRLGPPADTEFPPVERAGPAVISPDGTLLAMAAQNKTGESALWLRRLDAATPVMLAGTEGASHPFWSPDGTQIGFFAKGKLRAIPASGGAARILCDAIQGRGGAWSRAGVIVFAPNLNDALYRVDQAGGNPARVTDLDRAGEENSHRWPAFLPDGRHVLFVIRSATESRSGLFVTSLDGEKPVKVGDVPSSAIFVAGAQPSIGHLLYVRGNQVLAQPFSLRRMMLESEPRTVAELAWNDATTSRAPISASDTGLLVHGGGYPDAFHLAWQSASKAVEPAIDPGGVVRFLRLSPDARTAAIERLDFRTGAGSIWLVDTMRGTPSRLTFGPVPVFAPVWLRDGKNLLYTATPGGAFVITQAPVESGQAGGRDQKELVRFSDEQPAIATDVTADGTILVEVRDKNSGWDIEAIKPGPDPRRPAERVKLAEKPSDERQARVSPDDRWIAYMGNEGGSNQVYVMPLRGAGPRIQVSIGGGTQPIWGRSANELYFVAADRTLMKATIDYTARLAKVAPAGGPIPQLTIQGLMSGWEYGVTGNPEHRVFAGLPVPRGTTESVVVLEGWQARLTR